LIKKISSIKPILENLKTDNSLATEDLKLYALENLKYSDDIINTKHKSLRLDDNTMNSGISLKSANSTSMINNACLLTANSDIINTPVSILNNQTINQLLYRHDLNDSDIDIPKSKSFDNKSSASNVDIMELRSSNSRTDQSYNENGPIGIEKDIIDGLAYLGENTELAALFSIAIPEINFPIPESLKKINNQTKINELNNLLIRILIKVSYRVPLVIIIDHLQWSDPLSWKLTELIFQQKPKLLFCLFSFPDSSYSSKEKGVHIFQKMKNSNSRKIILNGISEDATCEIIKHLCTAKFNKPCKGVSTKILDIIYQKTQGKKKEKLYILIYKKKINFKYLLT